MKKMNVAVWVSCLVAGGAAVFYYIYKIALSFSSIAAAVILAVAAGLAAYYITPEKKEAKDGTEPEQA